VEFNVPLVGAFTGTRIAASYAGSFFVFRTLAEDRPNGESPWTISRRTTQVVVCDTSNEPWCAALPADDVSGQGASEVSPLRMLARDPHGRWLLPDAAHGWRAYEIAPPPAGAGTFPGAVIPELRARAKTLAPLTQSKLARDFLARAEDLPRIATRVLYHDRARSKFFTERAAATLPVAERASLVTKVADEALYYETRYGSPLSYARPLDVLASHGFAMQAGHVFDFGYGYAGHLRLLATLGWSAVGIDVDPILPALYGEPGDQGDFPALGGTGSMHLFDGRFPHDHEAVERVGAGYDLVLSKNVLKRGYIHPERPADPKHLIDLGAPDAEVVRAFYRLLKPGAYMLVYNICPAPAPLDKPYVPWADGRSPFSRRDWQDAGFEILAFDHDDSAEMRRHARALGWAEEPEKTDLEHDLFATYTLLRRR
jgi:hypothetical protein